MKVKMQATFTIYYEADSGRYGTDDPKKMAALDMEYDPDDIIPALMELSDDYTFEVKPLERKVEEAE